MGVLKRGLLFLASAGVLAFPSIVPTDKGIPLPDTGKSSAPAIADGSKLYTPDQAEYYLDADAIAYIRPGLRLAILGVTDFAPGKKPTVEFTMTDDFGKPLDRLGGETPGPVTVRFVPATWDQDTRSYTDLLVAASTGFPTRDTAGTFQTVELGRYKYTFSLALANFDVNKPATLMIGGRRTMTDIIGKDYWANNTFKDFVPATGGSATTWNATTNAKCNNCHDPLALHGGNYRDIKTCEMCHNPNNMKGATLEPFNGQKFWHAIHSSNDHEIGHVTYPQDLRNCVNCHDSTAAGSDSWYTRPTRASCGGCHASVDFAGGTNHPAQPDDTKCANCHAPEGDREFDASIKGAHVIPEKSKQLKGLKMTIVSVANAKAGQKPTMTFKITDNAGKAIDPSTMYAPVGSLAPIMAGPTGDYAWYKREAVSATNKPAFDAATGNATYTFTNAIPADFKGTLAFSADAYLNSTIKRGDGEPDMTLREAATNPIMYVAVTGDVVNRRASVTLAQCNRCHDRLALHGGQRLVIEECVICHNANETDTSRRPAADGPPESVQMARMIHRIHTGEELTQDYTVYGFYTPPNPPNPVNFNEILYPGDRRNCVACHTSTGYQPPLNGRLSVNTQRDYFAPQGPSTVACLGCHDNRDSASHAYLMTAPFGESCGACHGANSDWSPAKVHAR
ncbi:MAG: OmcA/MtrC family decaheme c-type cytochrome [Thermoanaerobaculia bacterium]|nr:OmcA/MtrC family decaheme c-type cytochrome [Thermoanaerobaculia bacterium]